MSGYLIESAEITLADQFAEKIEKLNPQLIQQSENSELSANLPAALCDEKLLLELSKIPNKMGFKIGEVAEMLEIKQYVLRYWETEFDVLRPKKAANNQRYYTKKDVENAFIVRKLLYRDRFSIEGARAALQDVKSYVRKERDWTSLNAKIETLQDRVESLLFDIRRMRELFV